VLHSPRYDPGNQVFSGQNFLRQALPAAISHEEQIRKESQSMTTAVATKLVPLYDRIVVRRVEEAETTRGGIIIPDSAKDKPQEGEVIAVGKGKQNEKGETTPLQVKAGNRILFGKYAGTEIKIDGEELLIMREEEVLGVLDK
jgi:chaperonin GroES